MSSTQWSYGDRVVHSAKPEWGHGVVTAAATTVHEGQPCQRLTVRFDRAGVKVLSTAIAELKPATETVPTPTPAEVVAGRAASDAAPEPGGSGGAGGWLGSLAPVAPAEALLKLPGPTTDPFATLASRIKSTLSLYRFNDSGGALLDWAAAQTGLKDPLSVFSRHELEQAYRRFTFLRDDHLKKLMNDARRSDPSILPLASKEAPPAGQQAMRRIDASR